MSNRIEKYWKVNDRICVIQLNIQDSIDLNKELKNKYTDYSKASKHIINSKKKKKRHHTTEHKKVLNIINVYAPTTTIVKKDIKINDKLYSKIQSLHNALSKSNAITMIVGDFNSKERKKRKKKSYALANI